MPSHNLILVASANPSSWNRTKRALQSRFAVAFAVDLDGALELLRAHEPRLLVLFPRLLDCGLEQCLSKVREVAPALRLVVVTEGALPSERSDQVDAWLDQRLIEQSLLSVVQGALGVSGAAPRRPGTSCEELASGNPAYRAMVLGRNARMQRVMKIARRVASYDVNVLIYGESGTGKEMLARWIHCVSSRRDSAFEAVDLPAIPDELFESIVFGHERGSFTGATGPNEGKFQRADGGTLFLDEVSSLKLSLQPKLLRAIQERRVESVGGKRPTPCDVRIIAATNVDLDAAVDAGEFRADLFHRLNVVTLHLVPLRERRGDIEELARFFCDKHAEAFGRPSPSVSTAALEALEAHSWPGNVRELENRVQRAVLLCEGGTITPDDLFDSVPRACEAGLDFGDCELSLGAVEHRYIERVLEKTEGNQSQAAKILQIDRKTLRAKLQRRARRPLESAPVLQSVS